MMKSFGAVFAGYVVMVFLLVCFSNFMRAFQPGYFSPSVEATPFGFQVALLCFSLFAAAVGGAVAARFAPNLPFRHGYWLSCLILLLGLISIPSAYLRGEPLWLGLTTGFLGSLTCLGAAYAMNNRLH